MKAFINRYFSRYFSSWWRPLAHYASALGCVVACVASGFFTTPGAVAFAFRALLIVAGVGAAGMLAAACVNYKKGRKLEGLANLLFFGCLFLFPLVLYLSILKLMKP